MFTKYSKQEVYNILLQNCNSLYATRKAVKAGMKKEDIAYMAPEQLPEVKSDQAKTILAMTVEIYELLPIQMDYIVEKIQNGYLFDPENDRIEL